MAKTISDFFGAELLTCTMYLKHIYWNYIVQNISQFGMQKNPSRGNRILWLLFHFKNSCCFFNVKLSVNYVYFSHKYCVVLLLSSITGFQAMRLERGTVYSFEISEALILRIVLLGSLPHFIIIPSSMFLAFHLSLLIYNASYFLIISPYAHACCSYIMYAVYNCKWLKDNLQ